MKKLICLIVAVILVYFTQETVASSNIKVVDGDSLEIGTKRIRLLGIDAPEYFQECHNQNGKPYKCGQAAKKYLEELVDKGKAAGHKLKCRTEDVDRYGRDLSVCTTGDINLNLEMVKAGLAVSYKDDRYDLVQKRAKDKKIGIWQGKFMRPEFYRALKRSKEKQKNS